MKKEYRDFPCPLCGNRQNKEYSNSQNNLLFICGRCKSNFKMNLSEDKPYDRSYFDENHRIAYGKSYIEDEVNIRNFSKRRLSIIKKYIKSGTLLDAGSALGLFCDEARIAGFVVKGAEISQYAREFCENKFNIFCYSDFMKVEEKFDCITLWFTLEHIGEPGKWIKKAHSLLNDHGLLAMTVPNGWGAFARLNFNEYIKARPVEHFFEPSPAGLKSLLTYNNFKIERIEFFGLHPERLGLPPLNILKQIQELLHLGDTFEIYARKLHSSN